MIDLRTCPFCGGNPRLVTEHPELPNGRKDTLFRVECSTPECGVTTRSWDPKLAAIRSWERRVCYSSRKRVVCGLLKGLTK